MLRSQVVADLALEQSESRDLPTTLRLPKKLPRYRLKNNKPYRLGDLANGDYSSLNELAKAKITPQKINEDVWCECGRGKEHHSCMAFARQNPSLICNWRVLWYSLPSERRRELLIRLYADKTQPHKRSATGGQFASILGQMVCKEAFQILTSISAGALQRAKDAASNGHQSSISRRALLPKNVGTSEKWMDVRSWLEKYAADHAEMSPHSDEAYLPAGRRSFYYLIYQRDRASLGQACASDTYFLRVWREAVPWLIVTKTVCRFVLCAQCEYLKSLIDSTARGELELLGVFRDRLAQHYTFQSAQRLMQRKLQEICNQSEGRKWFMKIDVMESGSLELPVLWDQLSSSFFKQGDRLEVSINGSMWHGPKHTTVHCKTMLKDCTHGSNMQLSTILQNFWEVARSEGHLPEEWLIGHDNTPKEIKNSRTLAFAVWLLIVLADTCLWSLIFLMLLVGHTHDDLDRFFSRLKVALAGRDFFTIPSMMRIIEEPFRRFQ